MKSEFVCTTTIINVPLRKSNKNEKDCLAFKNKLKNI